MERSPAAGVTLRGCIPALCNMYMWVEVVVAGFFLGSSIFLPRQSQHSTPLQIVFFLPRTEY